MAFFRQSRIERYLWTGKGALNPDPEGILQNLQDDNTQKEQNRALPGTITQLLSPNQGKDTWTSQGSFELLAQKWMRTFVNLATGSHFLMNRITCIETIKRLG